MGRVLSIDLTSEQKRELEQAVKYDSSGVIRQRSQMILLKSKDYKSVEICEIVGIKSQNQVNQWIKHYKEHYPSQGLSCLHNAKGQGRKSILDREKEASLIEEVVKKERQKLSNAKLILEKQLGKSFSLKTLKNFLKTLVGDINE